MLTQTKSNETLKEPNTNNDKMSGSSKPKVPAWKLRREQMRKGNPPAALYNDELGGGRSFGSRRSKVDNDDNGSLASAGSTRSSTSCFSKSSAYSRTSRTSRCSSNASVHSSRSFRSVSRVPAVSTKTSNISSRGFQAVSRVPGSSSSVTRETPPDLSLWFQESRGRVARATPPALSRWFQWSRVDSIRPFLSPFVSPCEATIIFWGRLHLTPGTMPAPRLTR